MNPELARDAKFLRRFRQEAQATRRLRHHHIVQVDDLDQADDGSLFMAMEFVDGVSLRQLLQRTRGPLPLARALAIARGMAEALAAAHAQGLVHRDIKPDNVLLARDALGRDIPKVLDFGIVAMKESSAQLSSRPLLTPAYAPPSSGAG
jgi:serine/threonine-protein kinase